MKTVRSIDSTSIAFDQVGGGAPLILVSGALGVRKHPMAGELAGLLAPHFTVITYDRRGRGDSGDTLSYAVEREVEDIEALIDAVGGSAFLYGMSSGAVLALEAANSLSNKVKKLVMYEPPFLVDNSRPAVPTDYVKRLNQAVAEGRRGDAVEIFMTEAVGVPAEYDAQMRTGGTGESSEGEMKPPEWAEMESIAHTLAYDGAIMGDMMSNKPLPRGRWTSVSMPTLVLTGGNSPTFFHAGAQALVELLPNARWQTLEGQDLAVAPHALAPVLIAFLNS